MQPKSMVTKSPAAIAFSVGTPCGLEPCGDLFFGHANPDIVQHLFERPLGNALCGGNPANLIVLFCDAQALHTILQAHRRSVQRGGPGHVLRIGHLLVFQCDFLYAVLPNQLVDDSGITPPAADLAHLES